MSWATAEAVCYAIPFLNTSSPVADKWFKQLLSVQKAPGNSTCVDCSAPSPQWASPKFGIFICLSCAGIHRGLGVHISFVRSIAMDSFKVGEVKRMEMGGNNAWKRFYEAHAESRKWEDSTDQAVFEQKYGGNVGEEYKERLAANVEGREYVSVPKKAPTEKKSAAPTPRSNTPLSVRSASPSVAAGRKQQNETYFAKLGNTNKDRPADLPPSQGGKYAGFGSELPPTASSSTAGAGIPGVDDFQKDPVAALTKGFGWFTTTVTKGAKQLNEGYIQPTAQKIVESDLAAQARITAAQAAQTVREGTASVASQASSQFNRFVEGESGPARSVVQPEKKDFWDSFGAPVEGEKKSSTIGTAAMRGGGGGNKDGGKEDDWEKW
ncbi:MAG: Zn finger-containing GTPase- Activating Protein for ARF [Icmadophila ericetorum]|nr:Zn finger-containing GTPase- Activating Protein for ARF [Icmadophila ericetorum]